MTPQQSIDDLFFQALSGLTGGILTDTTTLMMGMVGLLLVMIALDKLKDSLGLIASERCESKLYAEANKSQDQMKTGLTQVERDVARSRYRNSINALGRLKGGC